MAKIPLTISTNYCADWGVWEGVREIMQNAMDSHDAGNRMSLSHSGETLIVENEGVTLDPKVWLLGTSSKDVDNDRGHFGEGLKLGVLALVRAGLKVKIVNSHESWTPRIEASEQFKGEEILAIYTHARNKHPTGSFSVEVHGLSSSTWASFAQRFLTRSNLGEHHKTEYGDILLDENMRGRIFVKGIFVMDDSALTCGYNFTTVKTDRDRRMVSSWDRSYTQSMMWASFASKNEDAMARLFGMLDRNDRDVSESYGLRNNAGVQDAIVLAFRAKHGDAAVPVANMADAREAEHHGARGIVVSNALREIVAPKMKSIDEIKKAYGTATGQVYTWSDLTDAQKGVYQKVLGCVEKAAATLGYDAVENRLTLVAFRDSQLRGLHNGEDKSIKVALRCLDTVQEFVQVLVHELAHDEGGDGDKSHEHAEGALFAEIIAAML